MHPVNEPDNELLLDRAGARRLDRSAIDDLGIPGIVLMENAARGASDVARSMIPTGGAVLVLAGTGNNGGDGWAMARHLHNSGHPVDVHCLGATRAGSDAAINEAIARAMGINVGMTLEEAAVRSTTLVVDALFGTGLDRPIEGLAAEWIELLDRAASAPILAVDLPSGLDADSGRPLGPTIRAKRTATFVARKLGMRAPGAEEFCGGIDVVGIGTPKSLLERCALRAPE